MLARDITPGTYRVRQDNTAGPLHVLHVKTELAQDHVTVRYAWVGQERNETTSLDRNWDMEPWPDAPPQFVIQEQTP